MKRSTILMTVAGREKALAVVKECAAKDMTVKECAALLVLNDKAVREFVRKHGIKLRQPPPANLKALHAARARRAKPSFAQVETVEEWLALYGARRFEPGTLDQILGDTFDSVGRKFGRAGGRGTSWTPYTLDGKRVTRQHVIAVANKIRAKAGRVLLTEPRREEAA